LKQKRLWGQNEHLSVVIKGMNAHLQSPKKPEGISILLKELVDKSQSLWGVIFLPFDPSIPVAEQFFCQENAFGDAFEWEDLRTQTELCTLLGGGS